MKIRIMADLHIDVNYYDKVLGWFGAEIGRTDKGTLTVIAGDISGSLNNTKYFLRTHFDDVIFIGGNHIVYNCEKKSIQKLQCEYKEEFPKTSSITFLEDDYKIVNDTVFIGATLWTDYRLGGNIPDNMQKAVCGTNDFKFGYCEEEGFKQRMLPTHCLKMFFTSMKAIKDIYDKFENSGMKMVLVTHTGFAPGAIHENAANNPILSHYVNSQDVSDFIAKCMPKLSLIIHGHTHCRLEYKIGNIPVICNTLGYTNRGEHIGFDKNLIIDLHALGSNQR